MLTITNEDNMELMARYPDNYFDLAIVDPPYGLGNKLTQGGTWGKKWQTKGADWDKLPNKEYFEELIRVSKNWIIWGGNYFIEYLPNCRCFIAWHKPYMDGMHSMSNVELALTSFDTNAKKVSINKDLGTEERIHVTQKPVKLYKWLLENYASNEKIICKVCDKNGMVQYDCNITGDLRYCSHHDFGEKERNFRILDTHLGSGSIAIACHDYGFDLTACELDKEYFDKAMQRINNHVSQQKLF